MEFTVRTLSASRSITQKKVPSRVGNRKEEEEEEEDAAFALFNGQGRRSQVVNSERLQKKRLPALPPKHDTFLFSSNLLW